MPEGQDLAEVPVPSQRSVIGQRARRGFVDEGGSAVGEAGLDSVGVDGVPAVDVELVYVTDVIVFTRQCGHGPAVGGRGDEVVLEGGQVQFDLLSLVREDRDGQTAGVRVVSPEAQLDS